ncbi:hypothetical protein D3C73_1516240 [compost metagenome]
MIDGRTGNGAGQRTQTAVLGGFAHPGGALLRLTLAVVRILVGATGHQCGNGSDDNQTTHGEHGQAPTVIRKCRQTDCGSVPGLDCQKAK